MGYDDFIRRSQLIVPFGVGAMVDFPEDTLMTAALDFWPIESAPPAVRDDVKEAAEIIDERLQKRLSAVLPGRKIKFFCSPSEGRRKGDLKANHLYPMPFVRFPTWLTCKRCKILRQYRLSDEHTPRCNSMVRLQDGQGKKCGELQPWQRPLMKPVRFILACSKGHIDDFPWRKWAHYGGDCPNPDAPLFLRTTGASGLQGTVVVSKCGCGPKGIKTRSMTGSFGTEFECSGRSPWLGFDNQWQSCSGGKMQTVQRGSSGVHFSHTMSSILIPPYSRAVRSYLNKGRVWDRIVLICDQFVNRDADGNPAFTDQGKQILAIEAQSARFDENVFEQTVLSKYLEAKEGDIHATDETEEKFRYREFQAFVGNRPAEQDRELFDIAPVDLSEDYHPDLEKFFERVVKVEQLKETRVYTGFSRITPLSTGHPDEAPIANNVFEWLPAVEVRGEGIFFQFNMETLGVWENLREPFGRASRLEAHKNKRLENNEPNLTRRDGKISERLLLAHSFSHALIKQLAFECGYDASSLKERLFVESNEERDMCAVLVYTASGDSEGSLGGLVERARPGLLENSIREAIVDAASCSNDPICMETGLDGMNKGNVAACHACNMLPETSCEHSNYLLDRSVLIGTYDDPAQGYFAALLETENFG